jgi:hypothetical protein
MAVVVAKAIGQLYRPQSHARDGGMRSVDAEVKARSKRSNKQTEGSVAEHAVLWHGVLTYVDPRASLFCRHSFNMMSSRNIRGSM